MTLGTERTRPLHLLLGGFTAAIGVLTGLLFVFHPLPISVALDVAAVAILGGFGLSVLVAARRGRVGAQRRMPVRGTSAVLVAVGLLLVGLGAVYGWIVAAVGLYPLLAAAFLARGERLRPGARPSPVAPDGSPTSAVAAGSPRLAFVELPGPSVPVPADHPAHRLPEPPPEHPVGVARAAGLTVIAARVARRLLRRR